MHISILFIIPILISLSTVYTNKKIKTFIIYIGIIILTAISVYNFFSSTTIIFNLNYIIHNIFSIVDVFLLIFFLIVGYKYKNKLVSIFAFLQLILYIYILTLDKSIYSHDILVDKISSTMLLVINIIGSIIIMYAIKYIDSEKFSDKKKSIFISTLFFFLSVMNLIVATNNLEIFFLAFEFTTLCSYLLIRYREDEVSINNALRVLWMNQIGGVAILIAIITSINYYDTVSIDTILNSCNDIYLLPFSMLIIASFVKGASVPFDKWLLGAMIAPTPVSAILHSATMVKIAPYLILKISPAFSMTLSTIVLFSGSFIFMVASLFALSKDYFKEILGLSTIALLALMMAIASIGTEESTNIVLILIVFHAISKALLFLQAGILEKVFYVKYLQDIDYLYSKSPLIVYFILIGFASLTLPPFGAFLGKYASIELISSMSSQNIFYIFSLVFILIGSVFLTLLYFKVVTKLLPTKSSIESRVTISFTYKFTSFLLIGLLFFGIGVSFGFGILDFYEMIIPTIILALLPILFVYLKFDNIKRVKEYNCGESDDVELSAYYFDIDPKLKRVICFISLSFLGAIVMGGIL